MKSSEVRKILFAAAFITVAIVVVLKVWYNSNATPSLPIIGTVPEFSMLDEDSARVTSTLFRGKVSITDFIFTSCAGTCPMMSTRMAELQVELNTHPEIQFVSFSVDPETDTPAVLEQYARGYGAQKGKWIFLTGNKKETYELTRQGFHLGLDTEGEDAIIHSQKFVLVDPDGLIRGYYDSEEDSSMQRLVIDATLLGEIAK